MNTLEPEHGAQYLTFGVAGETFAIPILRVREVVAMMPITRVPSCPKSIRGVVNLRGDVVPVIDLGVRFGGEPLVKAPRACIVIVEASEAKANDHEAPLVGLLVDIVCQVVEINDDAISPVPEYAARAAFDLLRGMGLIDGGFVLIVDVDRVVSPTDLAPLAQPVAQPIATTVAPPPSETSDTPESDVSP